MLIYNYQKEFLGIDELDLKALGFSDFAQLRSESADFADLFVKTPGFVHNFKHVHWIDFVTCAEGSEESKVIIHVNGKNFRCTLDIKTAFLVDDPSQKAYLVNLVNLRALSHKENEEVAGDVLEKPAPRVSTEKSAIFANSQFEDNFSESQNNREESVQTQEAVEEVEVTHDPYEIGATQTYDTLEENPMVVDDIYEEKAIDLGDELLEIDEIEEIQHEETIIHEEPTIEEDKTVVLSQVLNVGADYMYDPHLASEELGLPVDLIEEFIQDFINQAEEFKVSLQDSLNSDDIDNVKILSHKLKGVAANLRIEDAFEVLTTINTSEDNDEIQTNLNTFYIIIEKLSGKTFQQAKVTPDEVEEAEKLDEDDDDDLVLSFKDEEEVEFQLEEPLEIEEVEEPSKIEIDIPDISELAEVPAEQEIQEELDLNLDLDLDEQEVEVEIAPDIENLEDSSFSKIEAADEIGIDIADFNILFDDYLTEGHKACSIIDDAIEQNNSQLWTKTALKLKSMSENMRITALVQDLESIVKTQDADTAKEIIAKVYTTLEQLSTSEG